MKRKTPEEINDKNKDIMQQSGNNNSKTVKDGKTAATAITIIENEKEPTEKKMKMDDKSIKKKETNEPKKKREDNNNNNNKDDNEADEIYGINESHELAVQAKYVCQARPASLGPLPPPDNDSEDENNTNNKKNGRRRKKKRPRDKKLQNTEKLCLYLLRGEECPHLVAESSDKNDSDKSKGSDAKQDQCTVITEKNSEDNNHKDEKKKKIIVPPKKQCIYSHDIESYVKTKPPDIPIVNLSLATSERGQICPMYANTGCCKFGVTCRVGSCHLRENGENIIDHEKKKTAAAANDKPTTLNVMEPATCIALRKKQYKFKCPRNAGTKRCKDQSKAEEIHNLLNVINPSLKKKKISFEDKIYIAPLTTVGNLPFRRIMKEFGADITCGEMAIVQHLLEGRQGEWSLLKRHSSEDVFGVQLASGYPDQITRLCEVITNEKLSVDFVDLNLGCPLDLVCQRYCAGASLMLPHSNNKLKQMLTGMINSLGDIPITIKMRTGWDIKNRIAHTLINTVTEKWNINNSVCAAFMVHGRSRLQRYSKSSNWDYVYNDVACTSQQHFTNVNDRIPLIGNGDIFSYQDYKTQVEDRINSDNDNGNNNNNSLSKTAMLGRGALIKPWLPQCIKEHRDHYDISSTERFDILQKFVWYGLEHWGSDTQGVNTTRRFLLEWLSFLHRYVPIGLLPEGYSMPKLNMRPPTFIEGRDELETLMLSPHSHDWIKISERLLGKVPEKFKFEPKHSAQAYYNKATTRGSSSTKQSSW